MNPDFEADDPLVLMQSMRDSLRDLTELARQQNDSLKSTSSGGFLSPMPVSDPFDGEIQDAGGLTDPFPMGNNELRNG